jgi:hypothetical protein
LPGERQALEIGREIENLDSRKATLEIPRFA